MNANAGTMAVMRKILLGTIVSVFVVIDACLRDRT